MTTLIFTGLKVWWNCKMFELQRNYMFLIELCGPNCYMLECIQGFYLLVHIVVDLDMCQLRLAGSLGDEMTRRHEIAGTRV